MSRKNIIFMMMMTCIFLTSFGVSGLIDQGNIDGLSGLIYLIAFGFGFSFYGFANAQRVLEELHE